MSRRFWTDNVNDCWHHHLHHEADKEIRPPPRSPTLSPLSRLARRVDDSRRWAPVLDPWQNHCEWLVKHHRKLEKRFRKTSTADRLSEMVTALKDTRERGSNRRSPVVRIGANRKRSRSEMAYSDEEAALNTWLEAEDPNGSRAARCLELASPSDAPSSRRGSPGHSRSTPELPEHTFAPDKFRTSTPNASEEYRWSDDSPPKRAHRSSEWTDYVMSQDPILFRSYVGAKHPSRSWRRSHQKVVTRHSGRGRKSSGKIRRPSTPKSLKVSWSSLDDMLNREGILKSPLQITPMLPCDVTTTTRRDGHTDDDERSVVPLTSPTTDTAVVDRIGLGIRAIREECTPRDTASGELPFDDVMGEPDRADPSELSDISLSDDETQARPVVRDERDDEVNEEDVNDICRMVSTELGHPDDRPNGLLTDTTFSILESLDINPMYPPDYFRAGFADRAGSATRPPRPRRSAASERLGPEARWPAREVRDPVGDLEKPDRRVVEFRVTPDPDSTDGKTKHRVGRKKVSASNINREFAAGPHEDDRKLQIQGVNNLESIKESVENADRDEKQCLKQTENTGVAEEKKAKTGVKSERARGLRHLEEKDQQTAIGQLEREDVGKIEKKQRDPKVLETTPTPIPTPTPLPVPIPRASKGQVKGKRAMPHRISVVMGRRPAKPSSERKDTAGADRKEQVLPWTPGSGDDDNGGVVPQRIPQLRRIEIQHGDASLPVSSIPDDQVERLKSDKEPGVLDGNCMEDEDGASKEINTRGDSHASSTIQDKTRPTSEDMKLEQVTQGMATMEKNARRQQALMQERIALLQQSYGNQPLSPAPSTTNHGGRTVESRNAADGAAGKVKNTPATVVNAINDDQPSSNCPLRQGGNTCTNDLSRVSSASGAGNNMKPSMNIVESNQSSSNRVGDRSNVREPLLQAPEPLFPDHHQRMQPQPNAYHMYQHAQHGPGNGNYYPHPQPHPQQQQQQQGPRQNPAAVSMYHRHQMALRTAAYHYYNRQHHLFIQRQQQHQMLRGAHHPGFYQRLPFPAPAQHPMQMHPGFRQGMRMVHPPHPQQHQGPPPPYQQGPPPPYQQTPLT